MATKKAKKATKKVTRKATKKNNINIDFSDSINKIKETAISVNNQVLNTAGDVVEDVRENGEQIREVAVTRAKKAYKTVAERVAETTDKVTDKVTETVNMKNIKSATKSVNDYTLKTADELVDGALVSGQKWQGIANKAVKGSLKLAAKQQDIMFDTLETVKGQLTDSAKRLRKIFSNN